MEDRKKLLGDLADVALQIWALTHSLTREESPNWKGVAGVIEDQSKALQTLSAEALARAPG